MHAEIRIKHESMTGESQEEAWRYILAAALPTQNCRNSSFIQSKEALNVMHPSRDSIEKRSRSVEKWVLQRFGLPKNHGRPSAIRRLLLHQNPHRERYNDRRTNVMDG